MDSVAQAVRRETAKQAQVALMAAMVADEKDRAARLRLYDEMIAALTAARAEEALKP